MKPEITYDSFTLGYAHTPIGYVGYIDCMTNGSDEYDRQYLTPRFFATKSEVKDFLDQFGEGLRAEFGGEKVLIS